MSETSKNDGGNVKWCGCYVKRFVVAQKLSDPEVSLLGVYLYQKSPKPPQGQRFARKTNRTQHTAEITDMILYIQCKNKWKKICKMGKEKRHKE